jgi:hypothetical protein
LELQKQGDQIRKIQRDLDEIQDNLNVGDRKLRGISSIWGAIGNKFRRDNSQEHKKKREKTEKELMKKLNQNNNHRTHAKENNHTKNKNKTINNNNNKNNNVLQNNNNSNLLHEEFILQDEDYRQFVEEHERNLDQLHDVVLNLKVWNIAYDHTTHTHTHLKHFLNLFSNRKSFSKGPCFVNERSAERTKFKIRSNTS